LVIITVIIVAVAFCCLLIIIIFYPRQSLFSAHTHTTHNNKYPTSCSRLLNPPHPTRHATHSHTPSSAPPLSWASTLDLSMVFALGSRVGWTPARNNE